MQQQQQAGKGLPCQKAGAKKLPPVERDKNTRVRMLHPRPRCARAFRRTCKAEQREQSPARKHTTLACAATPRRRRHADSAPTQRAAACARADQRGQRKKRRENGTGAVFLIQRSAPAHPPRTSCPLKTRAAALHDVNAFSAARIRQRKLRRDAALLSSLISTHLLAPLTHLRCARRRMRVSTVFGMLFLRGALERYAGAHPILCNARKCPFPSDLSAFRAQFRRLPRRLCRASRRLDGCSPEVRPPAGPAGRCAFDASNSPWPACLFGQLCFGTACARRRPQGTPRARTGCAPDRG